MYSASYVWAKVLSHMEQQLSEVAVSTWLDDAEVVSLSETELIIYSPSEFRQERIRVNFAPYVEDALKQIFQSQARLVVWGETERKAGKERKKPESYFNPQYIFENFIAGSTNVIPLKIASAVAADPGTQVYNPVFFYGPPGVGKTHLLYSIANEIARQHPDKKIVCVKGEQFTTDLVRAIQKESTFALAVIQSNCLGSGKVTAIAAGRKSQTHCNGEKQYCDSIHFVSLLLFCF